MTLRGYYIVIAAFLTVSIAYAIRYGYGILLPGMLDVLSISKTEAGIISGAYFFVYTLSSPILGFLSDKFDSRILLTIFPAMLAVGAIGMANVSNVNQAVLAFGLAGLGSAACWTPVVSLVQQWVDDRYRGTALSIATMGSGIGIFGWSIWLPLVAAGEKYWVGWLQMGLFGLVVAVLNYLLIRNPSSEENRYAQSNEQSASGTDIAARQLLLSPKLWLVGLSYACVGFTVLVPFTYLNVYAMQALHLDFGNATRFFSILAATGLLGKILLGVLSDRLGRIVIMMSCGIFLGGGCLGVVQADSLFLKYAAVGVIGLGFGAVWPMYAAVAIDLFPRSVAGRVIGIWTVFLGVGSILSPVLCGWIIDRTNDFCGAFNLAFVGGGMAALLLLPLVERISLSSIESRRFFSKQV